MSRKIAVGNKYIGGGSPITVQSMLNRRSDDFDGNVAQAVELVTGRYSISELSGTVGVATAVGQASSYGWDSLFLLIAYITINLGVFNLLPFPALDGGKLVLLVVELIRGKPLDPKYEGYINLAGFVILFELMIVVTVSDVTKLFR